MSWLTELNPASLPAGPGPARGSLSRCALRSPPVRGRGVQGGVFLGLLFLPASPWALSALPVAAAGPSGGLSHLLSWAQPLPPLGSGGHLVMGAWELLPAGGGPWPSRSWIVAPSLHSFSMLLGTPSRPRSHSSMLPWSQSRSPPRATSRSTPAPAHLGLALCQGGQ